MRYLVRKGDTLSEIAQRYGTSVDALMAANPQIVNADKIMTGTAINVPGVGTSLWDALRGLFKGAK